MPTKTKTTLRSLLDDCSLIVVDGGMLFEALGVGYEMRCWKGDLACNQDDWKFNVTETELELIEVMYDRLQYSFNLDQEIHDFDSFTGDSVSLEPVDGEQATDELVKLRFFSVKNLIK